MKKNVKKRSVQRRVLLFKREKANGGKREKVRERVASQLSQIKREDARLAKFIDLEH